MRNETGTRARTRRGRIVACRPDVRRWVTLRHEDAPTQRRTHSPTHMHGDTQLAGGARDALRGPLPSPNQNPSQIRNQSQSQNEYQSQNQDRGKSRRGSRRESRRQSRRESQGRYLVRIGMWVRTRIRMRIERGSEAERGGQGCIVACRPDVRRCATLRHADALTRPLIHSPAHIHGDTQPAGGARDALRGPLSPNRTRTWTKSR
jgi:hypothetical protein